MTTVQLSLFDAAVFEVKPKQTLQSILDCLDSIPNINRGGCGLSALAIYRWCKKNDIEVDDRPFVILCEDKWELRHNNDRIQEGNITDASVPHIAIQIDGELWDSTGNEAKEQYESYTVPFGEDDLIELLNKGSWNTMFKREKYRPIIELGLDIDLSDIGPNIAQRWW